MVFVSEREENIVGKGRNAYDVHYFCPSFPIIYSKALLFLGYLTHYHTTNFRLFQTERICR